MKTLTLTLFFVVTTISAAYAECYYNGQAYPTGTQIGSLVCQADGTWR